MKKRLFCLIVAVILTVIPFSSCAKNEDDGGDANSVTTAAASTDSVAATTVEAVKDDVPELDFNKYEFKILNVIQEQLTYMNLFMEAEELTGEPINDAGYNRSIEVEDRFNCTITEVKVANGQTISLFKKEVQSGGNTYDLAMVPASDAFNFATQNLIYDINEIKYIDLNKPWWDQNAKKSFSIDNRVFFLPGSYELSNLDMTRVLFFNKKMMQDYGIKENVYELVNNGKWTDAKFFEMAKQVSTDVNGDGVYNFEDTFGVGSTADHVVFGSFMHGSGENIVKKDADDLPYFAVDNERFISVIQNIIPNFYEGTYYFYPKNATEAEDWCTNMFNENRMLFYNITFNRVPKFRAMDADFGIIPIPKFEESQEFYYCESGAGMVGVVPQTAEDPERTGAIWEAYSAASFRYVVPAYKEVALKTKFARDNESAQMVDLIYNSRSYDLGKIYWGTKMFDKYVELMTKKSTDVTSVNEKNKAAAEKAIETGIEIFAK